MNNQDFCYWLQGYFELSGEGMPPLSASQVGIIERHIELCAATSEPGAGILAIKALLPEAVGSSGVTTAIIRVLAGVFEHIIDPKDGDADPAIQHIHNGGPGGPVYRC